MARAEQKIPGSAYAGEDFADAMNGLNRVLEAEPGLKTKPCAQFSLQELHAVQSVLFEARAPSLQQVYSSNSDTRSLQHITQSDLEAEQTAVQTLAESRPEVAEMVRDGICHETVMWYVHHLAEATKTEVKDLIVLPLLPNRYHEKPATAQAEVVDGHKRYTSQVSCAVCHVA